jgi:hypothetical protein
MNHQLFEAFYFFILVFAGFFIVWQKRQSWTSNQHLIAILAGWSSLLGCFLHIAIDTVSVPSSFYSEFRWISTGLMALSFAAFVSLGFLLRNKAS